MSTAARNTPEYQADREQRIQAHERRIAAHLGLDAVPMKRAVCPVCGGPVVYRAEHPRRTCGPRCGRMLAHRTRQQTRRRRERRPT